MIRFAHFAAIKRYPRPYVAISNSYPQNVTIDEHRRDLAPPWKYVQMYKNGEIPWKLFVDRYWTQLQHIWEECREAFGELELQGGATCLCYERPGEKCHRRILACFLLKVGFEVELDGRKLPADWEDIY